MANKNNFMSVGEIAKAIGVTRRMILHYEECGILLPDRKEGSTGNRYYSADTLTRIRTIRILQDLGLSLAEIHNYFDDEVDLLTIITRLEKLRDELNLSIEKLKARTENSNCISRIRIPEQTVYCRTFIANTVEERKEHLREIIPVAMRQYGTDVSKRMYFIEYPLDDVNKISYCIAIPYGSEGEYVKVMKEEQALCICYHGGYENIPMIKEKIVTYAIEKKIELQGTCRHIYLEGPPHHKNPKNFITQIALPFAPKN